MPSVAGIHRPSAPGPPRRDRSMTRLPLSASAAVAALLSASQALAQESFDLGEIVVSGALVPQEVNRTGAIVDVLDEEALDEAPLTLERTLDRIPGVSFSSNGGLGSASTVRIRGLGSAYVGVRIDGIDVSDPSAVQLGFDFGGLTSAGLQRVEVVRGSQSALYGSEAIAGVVDVTTFRASEPGTFVKGFAEGGSFGTARGSVGVATRGERGALAFNLARTETDGISARAGDSEDDGYEETFLSLSGDYEVGEGVVLGFSAFHRDAEAEIDRSTTDNSGTNFLEQTGARVFAEIAAFGVDHTFSYSTFRSERRDPGGVIKAFDGDRDQLSYLGTMELSGGTTLSFGLDRTEEEYETDFDAGSSVTTSALAEAIFRPRDDLDIAVSLRYDDNDDFGGNTSGRVALAWRARPDTTIRAVVGTGFRAPSLFERFSAAGDPTLKVEKSRSVELGVERRFGEESFVQATAFYAEIDDLIGFDGAATACGSGFGCYNQVPGTTVSKGLEIEGRYAHTDRVAVFGAYTLTDAETDGTRLALVPRHDLTLGVDVDFTDRLRGTFDVQRVADVEPSAFAPPNNDVGDYTLANLGFSYAVTDTAEAYLRVENLFDEDYETVGGYNMPGRGIYVGLRASF